MPRRAAFTRKLNKKKEKNGVIVLIVALIALAICVKWLIVDSEPWARYRKLGKELIEELEKLLNSSAPSWLRNQDVELRLWCVRRWWLWGEWEIRILSVQRPHVGNIQTLMQDRIERLRHERGFTVDVKVKSRKENYRDRLYRRWTAAIGTRKGSGRSGSRTG